MAEYKIYFSVAGAFGAQIRFAAKPGVSYEDAAASINKEKLAELMCLSALGCSADVLCWYEYFRYGAFNRMFQTYGIGFQFNGNWGGEVANGRSAKVLAWMPLPEPPKMDGGADK